jgi:hypothetical protein
MADKTHEQTASTAVLQEQIAQYREKLAWVRDYL